MATSAPYSWRRIACDGAVGILGLVGGEESHHARPYHRARRPRPHSRCVCAVAGSLAACRASPPAKLNPSTPTQGVCRRCARSFAGGGDLIDRDRLDLVTGDLRELGRCHHQSRAGHGFRKPHQSRLVVTEMMHAVHDDHGRRMLEIFGEVKSRCELAGTRFEGRLPRSRIGWMPRFAKNPCASEDSMRSKTETARRCA